MNLAIIKRSTGYDVFADVDYIMDINDPKVRWAQHIADKSGEKQVIVTNIVGGLDIKPQCAVELVNNAHVMAIIEPSDTRVPDESKVESLSESRVREFTQTEY